ncbi:MAG: hypothetical protein M3281_07045, partial [Chloroflexota bacterium]|nr:hypothetical protein [Chloroflexota bacterium]
MTTIEWRREAEDIRSSRRAWVLPAVIARRALTLSILLSAAGYFALFLLMRAKSMRLTPTLTLVRWSALRSVSDALTPASLATLTWRTERAELHEYLYAGIALVLIGAWLWALWRVRPGASTLGLRWILLPILVFSLPLIFLPGMFSGDIYLYMFYGRTIAHYGENPLIYPPEAFAGDMHASWVYWKWLPSAYGPVWLMYSGALSAFAGNALFANIFTYKLGVLALHLLATVVVWATLRRVRPQLASWGTIFYGWNPLVLLETVGSGHNDVMVALFVALSLAAVLY